MNPPNRKLQHRTEEEAVQEQQIKSEQQQTTREWNSAEELLRHDAQQTTVPAAIGTRLQDSLAREPAPKKSWWQRFLG